MICIFNGGVQPRQQEGGGTRLFTVWEQWRFMSSAILINSGPKNVPMSKHKQLGSPNCSSVAQVIKKVKSLENPIRRAQSDHFIVTTIWLKTGSNASLVLQTVIVALAVVPVYKRQGNPKLTIDINVLLPPPRVGVPWSIHHIKVVSVSVSTCSWPKYVLCRRLRFFDRSSPDSLNDFRFTVSDC